MRFAGLQVCFRSERPKTHKNSTEWNKMTNMWISPRLIHTTSRREVMHKRKQLTTNVEPLLLTIPQVAAMLGLGRSKVYDLIRDEGLPTAKFGTAVRVPAEELKKWVK